MKRPFFSVLLTLLTLIPSSMARAVWKKLGKKIVKPAAGASGGWHKWAPRSASQWTQMGSAKRVALADVATERPAKKAADSEGEAVAAALASSGSRSQCRGRMREDNAWSQSDERRQGDAAWSQNNRGWQRDAAWSQNDRGREFRLTGAHSTHAANVKASKGISNCRGPCSVVHASQIIQTLRDDGIQPDVRTYSAMISTCGKARNLKAAREYFEEMKGAGVEPNVITYNAMVSTCGKRRNLEAAREYFEEMKGAGVQPDVRTYSAMISTCEKAKNLKAVRA